LNRNKVHLHRHTHFDKQTFVRKMVLKLIDICLTSISTNLDRIKNIDSHLTTTHRELLIQRLANHGLFDANNFDAFKKHLFADSIKTVKFYRSDQISDFILKSISKSSRFQLKVLSICRCTNITGDV
jgi:hypothetical protein